MTDEAGADRSSVGGAVIRAEHRQAHELQHAVRARPVLVRVHPWLHQVTNLGKGRLHRAVRVHRGPARSARCLGAELCSPPIHPRSDESQPSPLEHCSLESIPAGL